MKTIMAFGDSLTWGTDAARNARHAFADRWPNVLQARLGQGFHVVAEGLGGRTTMFDDPDPSVDRNGANALPILLGSHSPLDLLIVMLGANDLKPHICGTAEGAAAGIARLISITRGYVYIRSTRAPAILVVSPPHFRARGDGTGPEAGRDIAESFKLAPLYEAVANDLGVAFFDIAPFAQACEEDGVHLDALNTKRIGDVLTPVVLQILSQRS